jgi:probable addiction module antidote protein
MIGRRKQPDLLTRATAIRRLVEIGLKAKGKFKRGGPMPKARGFDAAKYRDNPTAVAGYLNEALSTGNSTVVARAIGKVIRAQGATKISKKSGLRRDNLYRTFSGERGPKLVDEI